MHRVARIRLQQHRSVTHVCPEHYDHLLRHKPAACEPFKATCVCFPPKEPISQTRTEWSVKLYQTLNTQQHQCIWASTLTELCAIKAHIEKTKIKVNAINNIISKLTKSKWGCNASTIRPNCLAFCYSPAEYA